MACITDPEICKHRKKKESSVSKSHAKSKHKHIYKQCVLRYVENIMGKDVTFYDKGEYCLICGKVGERTSFLFGKMYYNKSESDALAQEAIRNGTPVFDLHYKEKFVEVFYED